MLMGILRVVVVYDDEKKTVPRRDILILI